MAQPHHGPDGLGHQALAPEPRMQLVADAADIGRPGDVVEADAADQAGFVSLLDRPGISLGRVCHLDPVVDELPALFLPRRVGPVRMAGGLRDRQQCLQVPQVGDLDWPQSQAWAEQPGKIDGHCGAIGDTAKFPTALVVVR